MEPDTRLADPFSPQGWNKRCPRCGKALPINQLVCPDDGAALVMPLLEPVPTIPAVPAVPGGGEPTGELRGGEPTGELRGNEPTGELRGAGGLPAQVENPESGVRKWEATVQRDILIGTQVGEYVVRRRIGAGGMGIVYEAEQPQINRKVAVKILRPDVRNMQPAGLAGEARVMGRIRHRAIVDVFGYGEIPAVGQYIVMEYLDGQTLERLLAERRMLSAPEVLWIMDEVLSGLGAAHAEGVIHGDLKPSNLFVVSASGGSQYVKILDFGIAKQTKKSDPKAAAEGGGPVYGTPEYMAPEQVEGREVTARTDLYSLGVIAFEMLTGEQPFRGGSALEIAAAQVREAPPRPSETGPVARELDALVLQLLEKDPAHRPVDAVAVRSEVKVLMQELGSVTKVGKVPRPPGSLVGPAVVRVDSSPRLQAATARPSNPRLQAISRPELPAARPADPPTVQVPPRPQASRLLVLVGAFAAVVLAGGGGWALLRPSPSADPAPAPAPAPPAPVAAAPVVEPPAPAPEPAPVRELTPEPLTVPTTTLVPSPAAPARPPRRVPGRVTSPAEPTREDLLKRVEVLRKRVESSTPPGGSPNPMLLTLLGRQEEAARAAADGLARAKVARSLDAFERQFEQSGDLKRR